MTVPVPSRSRVPTAAGIAPSAARLRATLRPLAAALLGLAGVFALAACDQKPAEDAAAEPVPRPVRVITVSERERAETVSLSGTIEAKTEVDLAFRIGGRLVERPVNVGDEVAAGALIGRLDDEDERNSLRAAESDLVAAEGRVIEAEVNYDRQAQLLERGFTTRQRYDEAVQVLRSLRAQVEAASARVQIARTRLDDTVLRADAPGSLTFRGAEPGEVVQAGQTIARLARDDGRDAVFDAPADLIARGPRDAVVRLSLSINPGVAATGRVREVSPQADPVTGAFRVRVGLIDPPPEMRLGLTVTGQVSLAGGGGMIIPAGALTRSTASPAVWVVDPATETVSLREIEIGTHRPSEVVVTGGLAAGDIVVIAGVQVLRAGQRVRLLGQGS